MYIYIYIYIERERYYAIVYYNCYIILYHCIILYYNQGELAKIIVCRFNVDVNPLQALLVVHNVLSK